MSLGSAGSKNKKTSRLWEEEQLSFANDDECLLHCRAANATENRSDDIQKED